MSSYIDDLTYEISSLEQDIERLEIEINNDRHSTPKQEVSSIRRPMVGFVPVRQRTFSQLADHNLSNNTEMARQTGRASHLVDHTGSTNHGNLANQGDDFSLRDTEHRYQSRLNENAPPTPRIRRSGNTGSVEQRRQFVKPSTFDGNTSWSDFKSHFEVCSELNGWTHNEKGMYLAVSLRGNAQGVLGNLPSYEQRDYLSLCKALEQRFAPSNQTDLYRAQLRERKQKALETYKLSISYSFYRSKRDPRQRAVHRCFAGCGYEASHKTGKTC